MAIYCGMDFHPRQQSVSYCDAADGEGHYRELHHERDDLTGFYSQFDGEVIRRAGGRRLKRMVRATARGYGLPGVARRRGRDPAPGQAPAEERPA